MTLKPITKALMAYGVITLLALGMALLHIGGLFPGLLLMGGRQPCHTVAFG